MKENEKSEKKNASLEKARKTRKKNNDEKIWEKVAPRISQTGCLCGLKKGMSREDLLKLGAGCTDPHDYKFLVQKKRKKKRYTKAEKMAMLNESQGYVCPTLDYYRRILGD